MSKQNKTALKTMAIKARMANKIRTALYKKTLETIPDQTKIALFDEIHALNHEIHWELVFFKQKRQLRKRIEERRIKTGYKPKQKTSLLQYQESLKNQVKLPGQS